MNHRLAMALAWCAFAVTMESASAQTTAAPAKLVYTIHMTGQGPQMGAVPGGDMQLNFTIKTTDPDGTRHGTVVMDVKGMPSQAEVPIDAAISPAGAISVAYNPSDLQVKRGMSQTQIQNVSKAAEGAMFQYNLRPFNAFATACGSQNLQTGLKWHAAADQSANSDIDYAVTGRQAQMGRDTVAVTMQSASGAMMALTGNGNYDPAAHLVTALHYELKSPDKQQTEVVDMTLAASSP